MPSKISSLIVFSGFSGGIHSTNLRKKACNSNRRKISTGTRHSTNLAGLEKILHSNLSREYGRNCIRDRLALSAYVGCSLMPLQLYVFDPKYRTVQRPVMMPMLLQTATSRIQLSHQHSLKLGNMCWKVNSINSKSMDKLHSSTLFLSISAFAHHPSVCATTNSSKTVPLMVSQLMPLPGM